MFFYGVTAKRVNGAIVKGWIYKDALKPIAETDASGNVVSFFVYGTSALSPDYMIRDGVTYRFIRDVQGSVRLVIDTATGIVAQRMDYDAFGNVLLDTNPGFQPFGFQSGLYYSDTGLVHFGARWYDPSTGRWLSKDPILLEGGLNLYAFCGNDPVNFVDPLGLQVSGQNMFIGAGSGFYFSNPDGVVNNRWIRFSGHTYITIENPGKPNEYIDLHFGRGGYSTEYPGEKAWWGIPILGVKADPDANRQLLHSYNYWQMAKPTEWYHTYLLWPNNCWSVTLRDFFFLGQNISDDFPNRMPNPSLSGDFSENTMTSK